MPLYNPGSSASFAAVAEDIIPTTNDTSDLGSAAKRWAEGHFNDFLAIGASPAQSGELRFASGGGVSYRNAAGAADERLIEHQTFVNGATTYNAVRIGKGNGILWDEGYNTQLIVSGLFAGASLDLDTYDGDSIYSNDNVQVTGSKIDAVNAAGTRQFRVLINFGDNLNVLMKGLPTANPASAGQLWNDSGTLKVSAG